MTNSNSRILGGILFIAGTSIGAGTLALPLVTAAYGFWPASLLLAALFMLEANLWLPLHANIVSMAKHTLGLGGQLMAWFFYLLLLYILIAAYLAGINSLLKTAFESWFHIPLSVNQGVFIVVSFAILLIYLGIRAIDYLNRFFMLAAVVCYGFLFVLIAPKIQLPYLMQGSLHQAYLALPVMMCSFGFQIIVPTLRAYLKNDVAAIKKVIIIGSGIPLMVYLIWEAIILGVLPATGAGGLLQLLHRGQPAVGLAQALQQVLRNPLISTLTGLFSFLVIVTSFFGVSLSLFDFLRDGLRWRKLGQNRLLPLFLTMLPPALFVILYPRGFIVALGYAGTCVAMLLGIFPVLMVWRGRYVLNLSETAPYRVPGGRVTMVLVLLFSIGVIAVELSLH